MMEIVKTSEVTATLPPAARAAVVLKSEQTRKDLVALAAQSAGIVTVLNADGREQAHRVGMTLKSARVTIEKTGKAAREDATAFSKAVIAEENALIALIEPEETRVLKLRDEWDEKIAAEKAAKIAAERARVEAIEQVISDLRAIPASYVGRTSAEIQFRITGFTQNRYPDDDFDFMEFSPKAAGALEEVIRTLHAMRDKALECEQAARTAEEARKAEADRLAAERAELARLRAEQAERERLAKIESDRIAAEQAAEGKRIADLLAAQEAELRLQREAEAARVRAEQAERDRVAAETKRQLDAQQAAIAAERAAFAREQEEAAQREDDRVRLQKLVEEARADVDTMPASLDELMATTFSSDDLPLAEPLAMPESMPVQALIIIDSDIIRLFADAYGIDDMAAIDRLESIDFAKAREAVAT